MACIAGYCPLHYFDRFVYNSDNFSKILLLVTKYTNGAIQEYLCTDINSLCYDAVFVYFNLWPNYTLYLGSERRQCVRDPLPIHTASSYRYSEANT